MVQKIDEFKSKKTEIIKAWTQLEDHTAAQDMSSEVGAAFEAIGEKGVIYCNFEHTFWVRKKGQLIRVM